MAAQLIHKNLAHEPRAAEVLARLAYHAARNCMASESDRTSTVAACALALASVCNFLGHFSEALDICQPYVTQTILLNTPIQRWQAWHETTLAYTLLGRLDEAQGALKQLQAIPESAEPSHTAQQLLLRGRIELYSNRYTEAQQYLKTAHAQFSALDMRHEAARCLRTLAEATLYRDAQRAQPLLAQSRTVFETLALPLDLALNDYVWALALHRLNDYQSALALHQQCERAFQSLGSPYYAALSHDDMGIVLLHLSRYVEAEQYLLQARAYFMAHQLDADVSRCDINLAALYIQTHRPWDALPLLHSASQMATQGGRLGRAARCYGSLAMVYRQLGQYERALDASLRARQTFALSGQLDEQAEIDEDLAGIYQKLFMPAEAESAYQRARIYYHQHRLELNLARCELRLAESYLAQTRWADAHQSLARARAVYESNQIDISVAECERLLAEVAWRSAQPDEARSHLAAARTVFETHKLVVQLAWCDWLDGELQLAAGAIEAAETHFERARQALAPIMPDEVWRTLEALGRCALQRGDREAALAYFMQSVALIQQVRAPLLLERFSATYFGAHDTLWNIAFPLAVALKRWTEALILCETAKSSVFTNYLERRQKPLHTHGDHDPYVANLARQEQELRVKLTQLREQLDLAQAATPAAQKNRTTPAQPHLLQVGKELKQQYEALIEQLRLSANLGQTQRASEIFSLENWRLALTAQVGPRWLCLTYHELDEALYIFSITAHSLQCHCQPLSLQIRSFLDQCADPSAALRERIYRGTLGGETVGAASAELFMRKLCQWLIPDEIIPQLSALDLLLIVPVGRLHNIPFQALLLRDHTYLITHAPIAYAPSLQAAQFLMQREGASTWREKPSPSRALICGLSSFASPARAQALPHIQTELSMLTQQLGASCDVLWDETATVAALQQLNARGKLATYTVIHFATHSVADLDSPFQSRIVLHDRVLSAADILDLQLGPTLVTLSSCQTASGQAAHGDELVNLARLFFYAGAQTVIASLWPVEDQATQQLMQAFYERFLRGISPMRALQQAQVALLRQHKPPYQWAGFKLIGKPC